MSTVDKNLDMCRLRAWQDACLRAYGYHPTFKDFGPSNVTVLCYFYRPQEQVSASFPYTACAVFETWRHCGMMKTVLVVNVLSEPVRHFCEAYPEWVSVQVEPNLVPGGVDVMSTDCNAKLCFRFATDYVLIVQDDGFPLRSGLERFLGHADFYGSPFRRRNLVGRLASFVLRDCPANGGFSLRSRKICVMASKYWHRYYSKRPFGPEQVEDIFYTQTLPRRFLAYRFGVHIAGSLLASDFSYDGCVPENIIKSPFGFHSARAFCSLSEEPMVTAKACGEHG